MKLLDLSQAKKGISNSAKSYLRFSPGVRISRINKISLDFLNKIADSGVMSNKRGAVYIWWVLFSASLIKCSNYGRKISSVYNSHKARHWQKVISMSVLIFNKKQVSRTTGHGASRVSRTSSRDASRFTPKESRACAHSGGSNHILRKNNIRH